MDLAVRKQLAESISGREYRSARFSDFELRRVGDIYRFDGLASVTDHEYDMGWYGETIRGGAFATTLGQAPDVQLLVNHEGLPIARTGRNMTLTEDRGLRVEAELNPALPRVEEVALTAGDGLIDQMSFAFRATRQEWDDDHEHRVITEVDIHRGDVSIVNQGANPATAFSLRDAHQMLSALPGDEFREFMASIRTEEKAVGADRALLALRAGTADAEQINMLAGLVCGAIDMADDAFDAFLSALGIPDPDAAEDMAESDRSLDLYQARAHALRLRAA